MSEGPIAEGWAGYVREVFAGVAFDPATLALLTRTFYAGAIVALLALDEKPADELIAEVETFVDQVEASATPEGAP